MRKYLAKLDWNNIESWNILKYEIESSIDKFVPLKKQENGLETFAKDRQMVFKQTMWRVYKRT